VLHKFKKVLAETIGADFSCCCGDGFFGDPATAIELFKGLYEKAVIEAVRPAKRDKVFWLQIAKLKVCVSDSESERLEIRIKSGSYEVIGGR
jgi:hypothetical protein